VVINGNSLGMEEARRHTLMNVYIEAGDFTYLLMSIREDFMRAALSTAAIEDVVSTLAA
jgi:hypothetical protein